MIFWRILDNKLYTAGEVNELGFENDNPSYIPDEYLEAGEFVVMRSCHGIGDWGIISAMPRLLKQKYPNCKVYVPSSKLLKKMFDGMESNWGTWENPYDNVEMVFKNNPYVDGFKDSIEGDIFHDHYRIYDKDKADIPLIEQMLNFWQFTPDEYTNNLPELYFDDDEISLGDKIISDHAGDKDFGALLITNRYENTSGICDEHANETILTEFLKKNPLPYFYYTYKQPSKFPFKFDECLDMRHMDTRIQLYIRSKAKLNIGTHCGMLDTVSGHSDVYQIQRVFPLNQNVVNSEIYLNMENYTYLLSGDDLKVKLLKGLPDKFTAKTTTSLKWKSDIIDYFRDDKYKKMKVLEVGSSLGHSSRTLSFLFEKVIAIDNLSERHVKSSKLNHDRDNIEYVTMDVYNQKWEFEPMDVVFIDCVHDYPHIKSDIDNSIKAFDKPILVFDDYGLFPDLKQAIDEYVEAGVMTIEKHVGNPAGTYYPKTKNKTLKDWEGVICYVK
jgi:hypothetical protein